MVSLPPHRIPSTVIDRYSPLIWSMRTSSGYFALKSREALLSGIAWAAILIMTFIRLCCASLSCLMSVALQKNILNIYPAINAMQTDIRGTIISHTHCSCVYQALTFCLGCQDLFASVHSVPASGGWLPHRNSRRGKEGSHLPAV